MICDDDEFEMPLLFSCVGYLRLSCFSCSVMRLFRCMDTWVIIERLIGVLTPFFRHRVTFAH